MTAVLAQLAPGLATDERLALTALVVALGAIVHAVAHTTAEGALPIHRRTLQVGAVVVAAVALYAAIRLWV